MKKRNITHVFLWKIRTTLYGLAAIAGFFVIHERRSGENSSTFGEVPSSFETI